MRKFPNIVLKLEQFQEGGAAGPQSYTQVDGVQCTPSQVAMMKSADAQQVALSLQD